MAEEQLSHLCKVCVNQAPKYRCPRCSCCTCSLQCYQRHQQWSQCSGKRDPGAYMTKSQLSTSAGIDHDYNFLTSIDNIVDLAGQNAKNRGIILQDTGNEVPQKGINFQQHLEVTRVKIHRAPVGMSREKVNQTRWHPRHKCIVWTLEWIHPDQSKELGLCRETFPLSTTYQQLLLQKLSSKKRKLDAQDHASNKSVQQPLSPAAAMKAIGVDYTNYTPIGKLGLTDSHENLSTSTGYYFYLVKPFTSGTTRILIPVSPLCPLSSCLRDNEIFEFPTIQVLSQPQTSLPKGFDLEKNKAN